MRKEVYDLIVRFRSLSNEEQKEFLKEAVINDNLNGFIEHEVKNYVPSISYAGAVPAFKERLEEKVDERISQTVDQLKSSDEELKFRLFRKFIDNYDAVVQETRTEICDGNHDYTDWQKLVGERPRFNALGQIESFYCGEYYQRECFYCKKVQKAWDEKQKEKLTKEGKQLKLKNGS